MWIWTILACLLSFVIGQLYFSYKWSSILAKVGLDEKNILNTYIALLKIEKHEKNKKD